MNFEDLQQRALVIRQRYAELEKKLYGRSWTVEEIALGFAGDIGDLMKLIAAKRGVRNIANVDEKLAHELADCLWSLLVMSTLYGIDLENAFLNTMDQLEQHIDAKLKEK